MTLTEQITNTGVFFSQIPPTVTISALIITKNRLSVGFSQIVNSSFPAIIFNAYRLNLYLNVHHLYSQFR